MTTPAPSSSLGQHELENVLWESLNSSFLVSKDAATKDLIGGLHPQGIEIETNGSDFEVREDALDETNIQEWIRRHSIRDATMTGARSKRLRVLLLNQVLRQDHLRPPADALAIRFSREDLYSHFGCSPIALEKFSRNHLWISDFPRDQRVGRNIACAGLGTLDFNLIWMQKAGCDNVWAVIMFRSPTSGTRARFVEELNRLRTLFELPGFLPFVAIGAAIWSTESRINNHIQLIKQSDLKLQRFPNERVANEVYGASLAVAGGIASNKRHTKIMHKMVDKCLNMKTPANIKNNPILAKRAAGLKAAFSYQKQVLQGVLEDTEEGQGNTSRQIECVLSIMAQRQQELSIEIARAQSKLAEESRREQGISIEIAKTSQTIAEETKKDGSSMKTLAVVTLIYLPCTTVSSVLAMPLFDWNADGRNVVSPRVWVFFVIAVPLTAITIGIWRVWLTYRLKGKVEAFDSDSASAGKQSLP